MRTPEGFECPFFYGDYYRGKNFEECRLIGNGHKDGKWSPNLCKNCPVPGIKRANNCEHMQLVIRIKRKFPFTRRAIFVSAFCHKAKTQVKIPEIGCGSCHPITDPTLNNK